MTTVPSGAVVLQTRSVGVLEAVREGLPVWAAEVFAVLTHLGDTAVLLALAVAIYVGTNRRTGGYVLGALLLGFAVTLLLKTWFALPRPPATLRLVAEAGYGFPSGHALGSTVGFGAMAIALERFATPRRRAAVAGVLVAVVSFSRVAIGVHYLVDVVAGVAVGLGVLAVATRWGRREPLVLFGLTGGVAAAAAGLAGGGPEAFLLLGAAAGALAAWQVVEPTDRPWGRPGVAATAGGGTLVMGFLVLASPAVGLWFGLAAVATAVVLLGPPLAERWRPAPGG